MAELVSRGLRTLCFAKSRKSAELIHRFTVDRLGSGVPRADSRPTAPATRRPQRREIERRLAAGELLGVAATDALELGIDIGLLDCVISTGFPGTVAQPAPAVGPRRPPRSRARRPRRERGRARPVLHARAGDAARPPRRGRDPRPHQPARARRARPRGRVRGAARRRRPRRRSGDAALERAALLPELRRTPAGFVWAGRDYPAARVPLRSTSADSFSVIDTTTGSVLGLVERERAYSTVHEGAVYLHLGEAVPRRRARPGRPHRRSSRRSPATSTRRRRRTRRPRSTACAADRAPARPRAELGRGRRSPSRWSPTS